MEISNKEIAVDSDTLTATIDASGHNLIIVQGGKVLLYPLPKYGKVELSSQNYKIGKPKYQIVADLDG